MHCALLQTDEIQVVVGDASRNGVGGTQYCGVWSMTSKRRVFNAFGNSYAGLIPGDIRGKSPALECRDDSTCVLSRKADAAYPVDACAEYRIVSPFYVDHTLSITDRKDCRNTQGNFREVSWCCYMNSPEDSRLHFRSQGEWFRYISPRHGIGSNIAPAYVPDAELETFPARVDKGGWWEPFHWDRIPRRFDEPFYYGRVGDMVLILIFDTPRWLRFFCSPSGGGGSILPGKACPAWDFEWIIPGAQYQIDREYKFRVRMVYKQFVSDDDVLAEYRKAQQELGFKKA